MMDCTLFSSLTFKCFQAHIICQMLKWILILFVGKLTIHASRIASECVEWPVRYRLKCLIDDWIELPWNLVQTLVVTRGWILRGRSDRAQFLQVSIWYVANAPRTPHILDSLSTLCFWKSTLNASSWKTSTQSRKAPNIIFAFFFLLIVQLDKLRHVPSVVVMTKDTVAWKQ